MDESTVLAGLTELFQEIFDDPGLTLTLETTAADVPDWDSLNHITIVVETERKFGIKFQTSEIEGLKNVGELVHLIIRKRAKTGR